MKRPFRRQLPQPPEFAYCEPSPTNINMWCIRRVTDTGLHLGGGVDTDSLCGRVTAPRGWDINVPVDAEGAIQMANTVDHNGRQACRKCAAIAFPEQWEAFDGDT